MANKVIFKNNYKRGLIAEVVAKFWLQLKGYCILERRYRNHHGEIDLIVRKGKRLIAIEIKLRQTLHLAAESISNKQRVRIERTLMTYLSRLSWQPTEIRFDVILLTPSTLPKHLKNAWQIRN